MELNQTVLAIAPHTTANHRYVTTVQHLMKANVLVIDDDPQTLKLLTILLERDNFSVVTKSDGQEAWHYLQEHCPDVICTDYMMPGINGIDLLRKLKESPRLAHIPVIIISGNGLKEAFAAAKAAGAYRCLAKPFSTKELTALIESSLSVAATTLA